MFDLGVVVKGSSNSLLASGGATVAGAVSSHY